VRDRKGFTPLQHALRGPRNRECAVILLESGAQFDVDIFETDYGTLLHEMYVSDDTAHLLRLTELMLATGPEDLATAVTCNDGDTLLNKLLKFFGSARPRDRDEYVDEVRPFIRAEFLRATTGTAIARLSHRNSVCLSVCLSVRHTGGSGKNGAS